METLLPTYESLLQENTELRAKVASLSSDVSLLMSRVLDLERQLGKDSGNSSKPPSTDVFKKKIQNNREPSGRKSGGQPGHKGTTLQLVVETEVGAMVSVPAQGLCSCGADIAASGQVMGHERRQVWDIPDLTPFIKEYRLERKQCVCGCVHKASCAFPAPIQYGHRVKALMCYLQHAQYLPSARTQSFLADIFGFAQMSEGTVLLSSATCYEALAGWESAQKELLKTADVLHCDETGARMGGGRGWAHVCSTDTWTLYQYHAKRGKEAHKAHGILPFFKGNLMRDRYSSYTSYDCTHSFCNAHLMRELKGLTEEGQEWAKAMYALINEAYRGLHCSISLKNAYQKALDTALRDNPMPERVHKRGKIKKTESRLLYECFRDHYQEIFRWFYDSDSPFDNNLAERDIRMFKLKEKISGCFRTEKGAKIFCRIRSYISTLNKQGKNVWDALCAIAENPTAAITAT